MLGQPESEHRRFRVGLAFLVVGVLLLLWAWVSWLFRASVPDEPTRRGSGFSLLPAAYAAAGEALDPEKGLARASLILMTLLLLLIVGAFGAYAAVIAVRRHRELMAHRRSAPTANADVWAMHRLPDDEDYSA